MEKLNIKPPTLSADPCLDWNGVWDKALESAANGIDIEPALGPYWKVPDVWRVVCGGGDGPFLESGDTSGASVSGSAVRGAPRID